MKQLTPTILKQFIKLATLSMLYNGKWISIDRIMSYFSTFLYSVLK